MAFETIRTGASSLPQVRTAYGEFTENHHPSYKGGVVHVDYWIGKCVACGLHRIMDRAWVLFWKQTGEPKGWAAYGPQGERCERECSILGPDQSVRSSVMEPLPLVQQEPFYAALALGGHDAVTHMVEQLNATARQGIKFGV